MKPLARKYGDTLNLHNIAATLQAWCEQRSGVLLLWAFLSLGLMVSCIPVASASQLRIGTISSDPTQDIKEFQPLATYLGSRLGSLGIDSTVIVIAQDIPQMADLLKTGKIDVFIDSPYPVLLTQQIAGNKILLRRWKKGVASYSGIIFARKDSGLSDIKQLTGKMVAFEESFSTASYFLPKSHLIQARLKMNRKNNYQDKVGVNEVGYLFSDDDRNTMAWVLTGRVSAGAMSNEKYEKLAKGRENDLVILATTVAVPRHLVTHRKNLDARMVKEIRSVLVAMEHSPEGLAALKAFNETTRFDDLNEADHKALDSLQIKVNVQIDGESSGRVH